MIRWASYILLLLLLLSLPVLADDIASEESPVDDFYSSEAGQQFLKETIKKAEHGDPQSQYQLADQYWLGWGVDQDDAEAIHWYTLAAEQGHTDTQDALGLIYAT